MSSATVSATGASTSLSANPARRPAFAPRRAARRRLLSSRQPPRASAAPAPGGSSPRDTQLSAALAEAPLAASHHPLGARFHEPLPSHPDLVRGVLPNGLRYVVLPNRVPPNRFEAHLELHCGSVDEGEEEQGVAHFVEHVVFLGSRKRERLLGTGARSNAYTDFHHTVFHVHSPTHLGLDTDDYEETSSARGATMQHEEEGDAAAAAQRLAALKGAPMLPQVLEALVDVAFTPLFAESRVEKERRAVLAEAQMMNTIEYRVDCQLLTHLHWENALGKRFPIGLAEQIQRWDARALREFHRRWYFPANATLYVVGDLPGGAAATVAAIEATFSHVPPSLEPPPLAQPPPPLPAPRRHDVRPPVRHAFAVPQSLAKALSPTAAAVSDVPLPGGGWPMEAEAQPQLFQHSLLDQFSLSLFSKLPVVPVRSLGGLHRIFAQRIVLSVLQFRCSRKAAQAEKCPFVSCDLDHSDSGREGCAVSTLTITAAPEDWAAAIRAALAEAKRLAVHGVTPAELERYVTALMRDSAQLAGQAGTVPSLDNLDFLMESDALGHAVMDQTQGHEALLAVCGTVTREHVNDAAAELLGYAAFYGVPVGERDARSGIATAIVVSVPEHLGDGSPFQITGEEVAAVLSEQTPVLDPMRDVAVPRHLISPDEVALLAQASQPRFVPLDGTPPPPGWAPPAEPPTAPSSFGVLQRRLSNGLRVNYRLSSNEPAAASLRLCAPGGRASESRTPGSSGVGAVALGTRAISECGAVGGWEREEVELFCVTRLVNMALEADEEFVKIDCHVALGDGGLRAAMEVLHLMLTAPRWEETALERAKAMYTQHVRAMHKSLERATSAKLMHAMLDGDRRFLEPDEASVAQLDLAGARSAIESTFSDPAAMELSIVGDFDVADADALVLQYLGTIQSRAGVARAEPETPPAVASLPASHPSRHLRLFLPDSDERAIAYCGGPAPNRWGWGWAAPLAAPALGAFDPFEPGDGSAIAMDAAARLAHPLYHAGCLALLAEVINSRLFTTVRDAFGLTYDVSFELSSFDRLQAGWFLLSVTSTPAKIDAALDASVSTLRGLLTSRVSPREVERARKTLLTRHESDQKDNAYLLGLITHSGADSVPKKSVDVLGDIQKMYMAVNAQDVQRAFLSLKTGVSDIFTCVGTAGKAAPVAPPQQPAGPMSVADMERAVAQLGSTGVVGAVAQLYRAQMQGGGEQAK